MREKAIIPITPNSSDRLTPSFGPLANGPSEQPNAPRRAGLPQVIWRHGVRAAITPIVTALGIDIGVLLGGAVLVETVFAVPGVGYLAYQGIQSADLPIIQGTVLFGALFIVVANLIVDIGYAFLDPRVRYD